MEEDEGEFTLTYKRKLTSPIPPFEQVQVGSFLPLGSDRMFVSEKGQASVVGAEGELSQSSPPGRPIHYIDGNASGQAIRLILDAGGITLHQGEPLEFKELVVRGQESVVSTRAETEAGLKPAPTPTNRH